MKGVKGFQAGRVVSQETRNRISAALRKKVYFNCDYCGKEASDKPSHYARKKRHYCSRKCYTQDRKRWPKEEQHAFGSGHTEETRDARKKCRNETNWAIRRGQLLRKECEMCGEPKAEAHHDDYSKPLDVRWLCFAHHREWHREHPELLEGE